MTIGRSSFPARQTCAPIGRDEMVDLFVHFLRVVEAGTFTAAARQVHLTQPALTASIKRLESLMGGLLFVRGRTGAELTDAGRALLPHARASIVAAEEGKRAVDEVMGAARGELRIGAGTTAITYLLPSLMGVFRRKHPKIGLKLFERGQDVLLESFERGELDFAIATGPVEGAEPFRDDELVLVHAPGLDPQELPFLSFPVGTATRTMLDRHFPGVVVVLELSSTSALKGQLRAGLGVALVSRRAVATDLDLGRLVVWRHGPTPITRELVLVHRGLSRLSPAAQAMRTLLLEEAPSSVQPRRRKRESRAKGRSIKKR